MAHYAFLENGTVTHVIVGKDENERDWESYYSAVVGQICKRTSYNTFGGVHFGGGTPFRFNYAGIGFTYDEARDAFIPPKPFDSWVLDEDTCLWEAPVALPDDADTIPYVWDEEAGDWVAVSE